MNNKRNFVAKDLKVSSWEDIKPYLEDLKNRKINSAEELLNWWKNRSELDAFLEEDMAWRYIKMSCNTTDKKLSDSFNFFVSEIEPKVSEYNDFLDKKLISSEFLNNLDSEKYFVPIRALKRDIELFRKENITIFAELQKKAQEFGNISAAMTIKYNNEEITLQKAANYLKDTDRYVRKEVYELINNRRLQDSDKLNLLMSELIENRHKVAKNAGFENFRDYMFASLKRFDYTKEDCFEFHNSIKENILPLVENLHKTRLAKLKYETLKPYDTEVDEDLKPPIIAFNGGDELIDKSISVFTKIRPKYGEYLTIMKEKGYIDLDSRKGKSPGGFNYPLYESNIPFIFTNATGNLRDVETIMHEGGHAVHSFLSSDLELVDFKSLPSEVAELASMSMELISMEHWGVFFSDEEKLKRARKHQLEGVIKVLPWIATIDKFQHLLYTKHNHTTEERKKMWNDILTEFSSRIVDKSGYENFYSNAWQKQLHIFEVPFYYIEYAISQLGAIAIWRNYKQNPEKALNDYENALKLGYSKTIPEIYETAGIKFSFDSEYIKELAEFVQKQLLLLN